MPQPVLTLNPEEGFGTNIQDILKKGSWFKIEAAARFKPRAYTGIGPKDFFEIVCFKKMEDLMKSIKVLVVTLFVVSGWAFTGMSSAAILGPEQPASGPGGAHYLYPNDPAYEIIGDDVDRVVIYEPSPRASEALPVIAFMHGYMPSPNPDVYIEFIAHLVKKGYIVIFPYYQKALTPALDYTPNAANAIKTCLDHIASDPSHHAQPAYNGGRMLFGMVGHSMGGIMAGNIAVTWDVHGIPRPLALMVMDISNGNVPMLWQGASFDEDTNVLVCFGEDDRYADFSDSESFWNHTDKISNARKDYILVSSDIYGEPRSEDLRANHIAPTGASLDALDYYGFWKWATALMNYTFFGTDRSYALGNTSNQRYMGKWSNGVDVEAPEVYDLVVEPINWGE